MTPQTESSTSLATPLRIALVGCGKAKAQEARPARELYTGPLFRAARKFAERHDAWFILSAKHGLVHPDRVLEPYDRKLTDMREVERCAWSLQIAQQLGRLYRNQAVILVGLAGDEYLARINSDIYRARLRGSSLPIIDKPLQGLGIGQRLAWLKAAALALLVLVSGCVTKTSGPVLQDAPTSRRA